VTHEENMSVEKPSHNEDEYFARRDAELIKESQARARADSEEAERKSHFMKCPKDGYDLATQELHGVQVDVCGHCGGLWLDQGELDTLQQLEDPGIFKRVVRDVMASLGGKGKDRA
jgi:hypothetical protein